MAARRSTSRKGLLPIEPLPSLVWYQDMLDFAKGVSDERAGRGRARAIQGKGAFRRFQDRLHQTTRSCCPHGRPSAPPEPERRAVHWLVDNSLIHDQAAAYALT